MQMDLRVGDREREASGGRAARARRGRAPGARQELEARLKQAYAARTEGDLARLTSDLPARRPEAAPARRGPHPDVRRAILAAVAVDLLALAIWVASGDAASGGWDEFWPKWVFILTTVALVRRLARTRRD